MFSTMPPETVALLDRFNVPAVFSGHIHIQDINEGNDSLYEAVTGSYSTAELGYGVLSLSEKEIDYKLVKLISMLGRLKTDAN